MTPDKSAADQLHDMATLMQSAVSATISTQRTFVQLKQPMANHDIRLLDSLLLDTLINAAATIALLRRMEHKIRYPDAFVTDEQAPGTTSR